MHLQFQTTYKWIGFTIIYHDQKGTPKNNKRAPWVVERHRRVGKEHAYAIKIKGLGYSLLKEFERISKRIFFSKEVFNGLLNRNSLKRNNKSENQSLVKLPEAREAFFCKGIDVLGNFRGRFLWRNTME